MYYKANGTFFKNVANAQFGDTRFIDYGLLLMRFGTTAELALPHEKSVMIICCLPPRAQQEIDGSSPVRNA